MKQHLEQTVLSKFPERYKSHLRQSVISEEDDMGTFFYMNRAHVCVCICMHIAVYLSVTLYVLHVTIFTHLLC